MNKKRLAHEITEDIIRAVGSSINIGADGIEKISQAVEHRIQKRRRSFAKKHPTITAMLAIVGAICTYYGFEKLIDSSDFLSRHPLLIFLVGIIILIGTGRLIKQSYVD